jgi:hypothetical protein
METYYELGTKIIENTWHDVIRIDGSLGSGKITLFSRSRELLRKGKDMLDVLVPLRFFSWQRSSLCPRTELWG